MNSRLIKSPSLVAILQALLAAVLFGASTPLSKMLLKEIDPIPLAALFYLSSGIGSWLLFAILQTRKQARSKEANFSRKDLPWLAGAMLAGGVGAPVLLLISLGKTPASTASLLLNFECVATTLIAVLAFKEAVDQRILWAVGLITLASILLSWVGGNWGFSLGALGILGACILWGLDNNITRRIAANNPQIIVGLKGTGAGILLLVLSFILREPLPALKTIGLAVLVGVLSYGVSIQLFILALRGLGAVRAGLLYGIAPFVGTVLSLVILREKPEGLFWVAGLMMLLGAWLMLSEKHQHPHIHEMIEHTHSHSHPDEHHLHEHSDRELLRISRHTHPHTHTELAHSHLHTPDLLHRHDHTD